MLTVAQREKMYSEKSLLSCREGGFFKVVSGKYSLINIQRLVQEDIFFSSVSFLLLLTQSLHYS